MSSQKLRIILYLMLLGAFVVITTRPAAGQESATRPRSVTKATSTKNVPNGEELLLTGNITRINGDTISVCDLGGAETVVVLSPSTRIATHRRGIFRGVATHDKSALLVGLNVEVKGRGNEAGQLVAKWIKFHDSDLRAETQVDTRAIPLEAEQQRQADQLDETSQVASSALKNAATAQGSADKAQAGADKAQSTGDLARTEAAAAQTTAAAAHARIAAIDDFEPVQSLTVLFKVGSSLLSKEAKAQLDEFAAKTTTAKGFIIELSAFASKEGGVNYNHALSARRAEAVMDYLVGVCNVPVRRLVVPYSGGILNPVADNNSREGRRQNRRAEVTMLVSKGLASTESVSVQSR